MFRMTCVSAVRLAWEPRPRSRSARGQIFPLFLFWAPARDYRIPGPSDGQRLWHSRAGRALLPGLSGASRPCRGAPPPPATTPDPPRPQEFAECISEKSGSPSEKAAACAELREDYVECLHHKKEARLAHQRAKGSRGSHVTGACASELPKCVPQITRLNALSDERARKIKAGEPVPSTLTEDAKSGTFRLPFTNVKS